jgi:hypothetical protein
MSALLIHYTVWKIRVPQRQTRAILLIFFSVLGGAILSLPVIAAQFSILNLALPLHPGSYLHIIGFVTAAALSYMITYTAIEVDSPSLVMALAIDKAGEAGLPEAEFNAMMNDSLLVEPRIKDMLRDGLITKDGNIYHLTAKGRRMAGIFVQHRRLLGAGMGG